MPGHSSQPRARSHWWAGTLARLGWNRPVVADRRASAAKKREVILYYAHFCSQAVRCEVARLRNELDVRYDIFAAGYCRSVGALGGVDCVPALEYTADELIALPYPGKIDKFDPASFIGNADLVPMKFFLDRPDYDYYWIVEYDVRLSGAWPALFADLSLSGADLLCTTMCQGRRESTSVAGAKMHQLEEQRESWFGFWQGEREGDHPSPGNDSPRLETARSAARLFTRRAILLHSRHLGLMKERTLKS